LRNIKKRVVVLASATALVAGPLAGFAASSAHAAVCTAALAKADKAVAASVAVKAPWDGPKVGPKAAKGKTIIYVAQTMQNGGVAGAAAGVKEAAEAIGWKVRVIDGQGTPAGISSAMSQAVTLKADGIVIGGFDPATTKAEIAAAKAAKIPVIGWHAAATSGPQPSLGLFSNVTTTRADVSKISADWVISDSKGTGGVVIFTDSSIPFAEGKSQEIKAEVETCDSLKILEYANIPIGDSISTLVAAKTTALVAKYGDQWTHSISINGGLYITPMAAALRAAGKSGTGFPHNVGAGDGSADEYARISAGDFQSVTVPEPLTMQGWQIVDEFNRALNKRPASGYVPVVHLVTKANAGTSTVWDPQNGYRDAYKKIWGVK
jgi:ABC-type sugar transport system substrate-binding protein